jgi:pyruvate formate-lyase/glycerol dehydratase family glycyl radical enzyme
MLKRIENLRNAIFSADDRTVFVERFLYLKQAYEKYRDEPAEIRHALITSEILSNISIVIGEDDLIVGRVKEVVAAEEDEELFQEIWDTEQEYLPPPFFNYAARPDIFSRIFPDQDSPLGPYTSLPVPSFYGTGGHVIPDWEGLLKKGMNGIKEEARKKLQTIHDTDYKSEKQKRFLQAAIISSDAVIGYADRYAKKLEAMIEKEDDPDRTKELAMIRRVLQRVPAHPAESFHEAIQSIWLLDLILHQVIGARDFTLGRADQYLKPFYEKDMQDGSINRQQAVELIECLFIKCNEVTSLISHMHGTPILKFSITRDIKRSLCLDSIQYCTVGGQKTDGSDAVNDVSFLILDAADELRMKQPVVIVRYFKGINPQFWLKACDVARRGLNTIAFYNDEVIIPAYESCGILRKDAMDYAQIACCHPGLPGRSTECREYWFNLPKHLELALNDGFDPMAGLQTGPRTGKVDDLKTFSELAAAVKAQTRYQVEKVICEMGDFFKRYFELKPFSFESILMKDCVEMAMDYKDFDRNPPKGTGYIYIDCLGGGLATVADSLAAIKKLVFDEKRMSLSQLNEILQNNFEEHEALRLKLLNRFPKYGNDDDYVDSIAVDIAEFFVHTVIEQKNPYLGLSFPSIYSYHSYACHGAVTGATPDGRKAGEPVSENQQAVNGMDRNGLTALLNSMAKLKPVFRFTPSGGSTISIHPSGVSGENGSKIMSDLIETYFEKDGLHVQTNIIDRDTLIDAKRHPQKHRELLVRVTGYSAYFVTLSPECQDFIIERATHTA